MKAALSAAILLLLVMPLVPVGGYPSYAPVKITARYDCSPITGFCYFSHGSNIFQVWANVTSSDPRDTVVLVEYALFDSPNVTIAANTGVRDLNVTFSPIQSRHICYGMTIYAEDSDGNWGSESPMIFCTRVLSVVSPYQSNFGAFPTVNMTLGSNEDYATSFTAIALVLNSTGQPIYETTGTATCAPFGNCAFELVFLGLPHGIYPVTIYALDEMGAVTTIKYHLDVTI